MLIRVRGNNDGVKEYLEKGQKHDREFGRDEMDERVILAGDLDVTDALIQTIATDAERYLHITLAFKEDELSREVLADITRDFEAFMFTAYRPDEYNFYAEAHVPRLKSYADRKSGELVERKVHIHIVVPSLNRLTGRRLDPFGKVEQQTRFLEAFQEHVNAKYGLASPRDNRRVAFTDASEMISRYKGDAFDGSNRELRSSILDALLARDITRYEDFRSLLTEFGEVRTRNAGRGSEYENVKPPGAAKGVNLKEYVFSREFVELSAEGKRAAWRPGCMPSTSRPASRAARRPCSVRRWPSGMRCAPVRSSTSTVAVRSTRFIEKRRRTSSGSSWPSVSFSSINPMEVWMAKQSAEASAADTASGMPGVGPNETVDADGVIHTQSTDEKSKRSQANVTGEAGTGVVALTLMQIDPLRRPNPQTVCEVCPSAVWMATPREVKCYCRLIHYWSWESGKPNELTHCDGLAISLEQEQAKEAA